MKAFCAERNASLIYFPFHLTSTKLEFFEFHEREKYSTNTQFLHIFGTKGYVKISILKVNSLKVKISILQSKFLFKRKSSAINKQLNLTSRFVKIIQSIPKHVKTLIFKILKIKNYRL